MYLLVSEQSLMNTKKSPLRLTISSFVHFVQSPLSTQTNCRLRVLDLKFASSDEMNLIDKQNIKVTDNERIIAGKPFGAIAGKSFRRGQQP